MKHVKRFELFESKRVLTDEQIEFLNRNTHGRWKFNSSTGKVDVHGSFDCSKSGLESFNGIKFHRITSNFHCSENHLVNLEGAPEIVEGDFNCNKNYLATLKGAPRRIGGSFFAHSNRLTSLEGGPEEVGNGYYCQFNKLETLRGAPKGEVIGFYCTGNKLRSLEGAPRKVRYYFYAPHNPLTTLDGIPDKIGERVHLFDDNGLKWTTKGKLKYIKGKRDTPLYDKAAKLIVPTIPLGSLVDMVSDDPRILVDIERADLGIYKKILKILGWDKMGPDLLRQLKNGII